MINISKPIVGEEEKQAILEVLESGRFVKGPNAEKLGEEFAEFCEVKEGIAVNSGTSAIYIALKALSIGEGDEVITTAHTFIATSNAIRATGATPIFVDTNELHLIDETKIEEKITDRTKAILPVHLYGQICEMDKIIAISKKHNLKVIEDCAQAHGATYNNQKAGSFGHIACFSFFPTKNMTVAGDGGIIITNDSELAELCRQYRDGGRKKGEPDESYVVGMNMRLSEILAAVARVQLKKLEGWNEARIKLSQRYNDELKDIVQIPKTTENRRHIYHLYVIQTENREELRSFLKENKIESGVHYSIPMHLLKVNSNLGHKAGDAPHLEKTIKEIVSIPIYPELTKKDQTKIIEKIKEFKVK